MKAASDTLEILTEIERIKRCGDGFITNFFLDISKLKKLIESKELSYKTIGSSLFILKKNRNFANLYFCSSKVESLAIDISLLNNEFEETLFVLDVVGFNNQVSNISKCLADAGFYKYTTLIRMRSNETPAVNVQDLDSVVYAGVERINDLFSLMNQYLDKHAEQIPNLNELKELALNQNILIYLKNNCIQGFLIFELKGQTSHLRYWFVLPGSRGSSVGSLLFRKYLYDSRQTKQQLLWVIETNENAIVRYEHYGFKKENLIDNILTNRNMSYDI